MWGQHWVSSPSPPWGIILGRCWSVRFCCSSMEGFQDPFKNVAKHCVCMCVRVCDGTVPKGACLECLLTCSLVSITRQSRTLIHQAFCSRDKPSSLLGWMAAPQPPRMSLPGPSPECRPCCSTLKPWELLERCQSWWPSSTHEHCCVKPRQTDVVSPSCQPLVQPHFQPPKLRHGWGDETLE